jgi:thymidylate synthase (FAD)
MRSNSYTNIKKGNKMKVKLIAHQGLEGIDHSIGLCYAKGDYTDTTKRDNRITKVALKHKHSSVLEFATFTFDISASTKVLLEMTRHRMASYACQSSRYTLNKTDIVFESTGNSEVDNVLSYLQDEIRRFVEDGVSNEIVSLMLPQAFQYNWTVMFNARSLKNFLELRRASSAHFQIREVAEAMYECIPEDMKFLFNE